MTLRYGLGDSVSISTYFGSVGEIGVNTTTNTIHVFDSVTQGGISLAKSSEVLASTGGIWEVGNSGINTFSNVGIGTTAKSDFKLYVEGNAKVTGILTVGNQSVTIDGSNNTIKVGSGVTIYGNTGIISATAVYVEGSQISSFSGDYNDLTNKPTIPSIVGLASEGYVDNLVAISTFSGDYNDLTNKPDLSNISVLYATSSGIATYASTAGLSTDATKLQTSRTFEITGDIVASPISFDGSGNVSLAATIQPNSVALGSDTEGDYVTNITGTANQIEVTGGTGEGSTPTLSVPSQFTAPQDVTVTRDLQVNRDLNVNGNITIGGTAATLFTTEFKVYDPDIVLGIRTDESGNDISTDNTANHGGIAVASTEGTPLISLYDVGIGETNPATYKKIMWFKSGTFSGLGTDAWLSNYAIGIGSTQVPDGVRLAAGSVKFTENDLSVVRNINASGIITASSFVGDGSGLTGAGSTVANDTTTNATFYPVITQTTTGTITSSKVSTTKLSFNPSTGTLSATSFSGSGSSLTGVPISTGVSGLGANVATFLATPSSSNLASAVTDETGSGSLVFANTPTLVTPNIGAATGTSLSVSGQLVSTQANSTTTGGGQIYLNGATGNRIDFNQNGVAAPSFTTRSNGAKIVLYPGISPSNADYAFGIEASTLWSGVPSTSDQFKWYAGTTNVATLSGTGTFTATTLVETSSITLKENINPIENALDKILQLNPVTYDRKNNISKNEAGLIAEEVNEIIPNIVSKDSEGNPNGINYTKLSVYLIDAIKELKKEIEDLRNGNS